MRVGIDVSPLVQTRAGTARYLQALLARNEYEQFSWGGPGRLATVTRDRTLGGKTLEAVSEETPKPARVEHGYQESSEQKAQNSREGI